MNNHIVNTANILELLKQKAESRLQELADEVCIIRGIWNVRYALKLTKNSTPLHLSYIVIQTTEQGCSYYDPSLEEPGLNEKLLCENVMDIPIKSRCLAIAGLDAVYAHLLESPDKQYHIEGSNIDKANQRAEIVCQEALSVLEGLTPKHGNKFIVVNVGVVGDFLSVLSRHDNIKVKAVDFYRGIVGQNLFGVKIKYGSETLKMLVDADLAIVTGMALATDTLDEILKVAQMNQTRIAMFAETGAHFASEYCNLGIDVVISEPLPFYLTNSGSTFINIYRKRII